MHAAKRWAIRVFVLVMFGLIAIETSPRRIHLPDRSIELGPSDDAKQLISPLTCQTGLWQGEWPLFAPDPVLNNAWLSAEIYAPDGRLTNWNSTYWASATCWEKFRRFRYINYFNHLHNQPAVGDFIDFLARQNIGSTARPVPQSTGAELSSSDARGAEPRWRIVLSRNQMNMTMPDDGSLPTRDDTLWIATSVHLLTREYLP